MKRFLRIISILLVLATLLSTVVSCGLLSGTEGGTGSLDSADLIESVLDSLDKLDTSEIASDILSEYDTDTGTGDSPLVPDPEEKPEEEIGEILKISATYISYDYKDYIGEIETIAYGLMIRQLKLFYDVFPGYIELVSGDYVYGLCYTDNSELYTNEDESQYFVMCGFLPFPGEVEVDEDNFSLGLYINDLEYPNNETKYIWKYKSEPVDMHCVVYGQYLVYGVDENGCMYFTDSTLPVVNGAYDFEGIRLDLPHLYSYDEGRIVFYTTNNAPTIFTGDTLSKIIDYDQLQKEIDNVIINQDLNFTTVEVENAIYLSQEAIEAYFLSYQEETFLGISVEALLEATRDLDPQECYRITDDGITVLEIGDPPPPQPKLITKWLVGIGSVLVFAVGMAFNSASYAVPALKPLLGAVGGAMAAVAIDIFMQVVVGNTALQNINWKSVGISCVSGAISGVIGPVLQDSISNKVAYYIVDTVVDAITGGVENAALSWMEGDSGQEIGKSFGDGFAMGLVFSGVFKLIFDGGPALSKYLDDVFESNAIYNGLKKIVSIITIPAKWVGNLLTNGIAAMANGIVNISEDAVKKITKLQARHTQKQVYEVLEDIQDSVDLPKINHYTIDDLDVVIKKDVGIKDAYGNNVSLDEIKALGKKAEIDAKVGSFDFEVKGVVYKADIIKIDNENLVLSVNDSRIPYTILDKKTDSHIKNTTMAMENLRQEWSNNATTIPDFVFDTLKKNNPSLTKSNKTVLKEYINSLDADTLKKMLYKEGASVIEGADGRFYLLPGLEYKAVNVGWSDVPPQQMVDTAKSTFLKNGQDKFYLGDTKISASEAWEISQKYTNGSELPFKSKIETPTYGTLELSYVKGAVGPDFDLKSVPDCLEVITDEPLTAVRYGPDGNFYIGARGLRKMVDGDYPIPDRLKREIMNPENGIAKNYKTVKEVLDNASDSEIQDFFKKCKFVLHEGADGKLYIMPEEIHDMLKHAGLISEAKSIKAQFGDKYCELYLNQAKDGATKTLFPTVEETFGVAQ